MAGQQGVISEIISEQALSDIERVPSALQEVTKAFKDSESVILQYAKTAREAANALLSVNSMGQLVEATKTATEAQNALTGKYNEMQKLRERIIYLESEEAKQMAELREQVKQLNQANKESSDTYKRNAEAKAAAAAETKRLADEDRELNRLIKEEERSKVADQRKKEALAAKEKTAADREYVKTYEQLLRQREIDEKNAADLNNAYLQLSKRYNEAALAAKNLQLSETATIEEQKEAIRVANELGNKLKSLDASVGQHSRNVGNYASAYNGLGMAVQQVLREAPTAISPDQFFLAIGNNLPQVVDELAKVQQALNAVKETAKQANEELAIQTGVQQEASAAAQQAEDSLTAEVEATISSIGASADQAAAIKAQIAAHTQEIATTGTATASTITNTESVLTNAGATAEQITAIQAEIVATGQQVGASNNATAALQRQAVATREADLAARSQTGAVGGLIKSIFSFNTLIVLGIFIISKYGDAIFKFVKEAISGKDAMEDFNKALEEANKNMNSDIQKLGENIIALRSNASSREEVTNAIVNLKKEYPQLFEFLTEENRLTRQVNEAVEEQIEIFRRQSIQKAFADVYIKSLEKIAEAQTELKKASEGDFGFLDRLSAGLKNETSGPQMQLDIVKKKTDALNKALLESERAYNAALHPLESYTSNIEASIAAEQKDIEAKEKSLVALKKRYDASSNTVMSIQREIDATKSLIVQQEEAIKTAQRLFKQAAEPPEFRLSQAEIAQKGIQALALRARKDSKEELGLRVQDEVASLQVSQNKLREKYVNDHKIREADLKNNASYLAESNLLEAQAARKIQDLRDSYNKKNTPKQRDNTKEDVRIQQDLTKEIADEQAKRRLLDAQAQELILQDESLSFKDRLAAIQAFYQAKKDAADISNKGEIDAVQKSLDKIKELESKRNGGGKLTPEQQNLVETRSLLEQRLTNLQLDGDQKRLQNTIEYGKAVKDAIKKNSSEITNIYDKEISERLLSLSEEYDKTREQLKKQYDERKITRRKYLNELKNLEVDHNIDAAKLQIDSLQDELLYGDLTREDYDKTKAKLDELIKKFNELKAVKDGVKAKDPDADDIGTIGISKKQLTAAEHYADGIISTFQGISDVLDKISEKRRAQTQAEIDAIDKRTQKELDGIDKTALSDTEKERKKAEINARAEAQKESLADKQKQRDIADARRQKAINIAKITIETALAVIKALNSAPYPFNIPLAVAAGAAGAAQLAIAIATPIPSYAEGTEDHPGGKALIGDNKSGRELVIEPGKKPYVTKGPEIKYLPMHTQVFPEEKLMAASYAMLSQRLMVSLDKQKQDNTDITKRLDKLTDINKRQVEALYGLRPKPKHTSIFGSNNQNWINS